MYRYVVSNTVTTVTPTEDQQPANQRVTDPRVERSRAAILATASELLIEGGVRAVTIDAIVERSGVARTTIYRHWPTRAAVLTAAFSQLIPAIAEADSDAPAEEALRQVLYRFADELAQAPWVAVIPAFYEAARLDPEVSKMFDEFVEHRRAPFAAALNRMIEDGLLPDDTVVDEALAQIAGPLMFARLLGRPESNRAFADRLIDLLLASRRPRR